MTEPRDPMTALMEAVVQQHEMYLAYRKVGFKERQALYLVGQIIHAAFATQNQNQDQDQDDEP